MISWAPAGAARGTGRSWSNAEQRRLIAWLAAVHDKHVIPISSTQCNPVFMGLRVVTCCSFCCISLLQYLLHIRQLHRAQSTPGRNIMQGTLRAGGRRATPPTQQCAPVPWAHATPCPYAYRAFTLICWSALPHACRPSELQCVHVSEPSGACTVASMFSWQHLGDGSHLGVPTA